MSRESTEVTNKHNSPIIVNSTDIKPGNVLADFQRLRNRQVIVNGTPLKDYDEQYNEFKTLDDVRKFCNEVLLQDFTGNNKEEVTDYLMSTFHQGGYMFPISSPLSVAIVKSGYQLDSNPKSFTGVISISTTENGLQVAELYTSMRCIDLYSSAEIPYVEPDPGKEYVLDAEAVLDLDFSTFEKTSDSNNVPTVSVLTNTIAYGNSALGQSMEFNNLIMREFISSLDSALGNTSQDYEVVRDELIEMSKNEPDFYKEGKFEKMIDNISNWALQQNLDPTKANQLQIKVYELKLRLLADNARKETGKEHEIKGLHAQAEKLETAYNEKNPAILTTSFEALEQEARGPLAQQIVFSEKMAALVSKINRLNQELDKLSKQVSLSPDEQILVDSGKLLVQELKTLLNDPKLSVNEVQLLDQVAVSATHALKNPKNTQSLNDLANYAEVVSGKPSSAWKAFGAALLTFTAAALVVVGVLGAIPSGGASLALVAGGALLLTAVGTASIIHGREKGLAQAVSNFKESLSEMKAEAQSPKNTVVSDETPKDSLDEDLQPEQPRP